MICKWHCCDNEINSDSAFCSLKCKNKFGAQKARMKLKVKAFNYKGGACEMCGLIDVVDVFDFHHLNSHEKDFGIAQKGYLKSWKSIKNELDKCILLCANCHRRGHFNHKQTKYILEEILDEQNKEVIVCKYYCNDCNIKISSNSLRCRKCALLARESIDWPSDEELFKLVWNKPMIVLAKELGVSDKAIAKRCKRRNIARPKQGYFNHSPKGP